MMAMTEARVRAVLAARDDERDERRRAACRSLVARARGLVCLLVVVAGLVVVGSISAGLTDAAQGAVAGPVQDWIARSVDRITGPLTDAMAEREAVYDALADEADATHGG